MNAIFRTAFWNCGMFSLHTESQWAIALWRRWMQWFTCDPPAQHLGSNPSCTCHHFSLTGESAGRTHPPSLLSIRLIVGGSSGASCRKECSLERRRSWVNPILAFMRGKMVSTKTMSLFWDIIMSQTSAKIALFLEYKQGFWCYIWGWAGLWSCTYSLWQCESDGYFIWYICTAVWRGPCMAKLLSPPEHSPGGVDASPFSLFPATASPLLAAYCTHPHTESGGGEVHTCGVLVHGGVSLHCLWQGQ